MLSSIDIHCILRVDLYVISLKDDNFGLKDWI